jgi:hypothetical protein
MATVIVGNDSDLLVRRRIAGGAFGEVHEVQLPEVTH